MPASLQASRLSQVHRDAQLRLRAHTLRDLLRLWPALDWQAIQATYPAWFTGVSALIARDRASSSQLAAAYVRAFRAAEGVPGQVSILLQSPALEEQVAASMRVTSQVAFKRGVAAGMSTQTAAANAFVTNAGAVARLVLDGGRGTIQKTLAADEHAAGWRRLVSSHACDFCGMLAGRGAVYAAATADFASHDHCACMAEPAYDVDLRQVRDYTPSTRRAADPDVQRARHDATREWLRSNGYG